MTCELWVSADDRLILYRPEGADAVAVSRAGRSLDVPSGKPVVLIDQDQIDVDSNGLVYVSGHFQGKQGVCKHADYYTGSALEASLTHSTLFCRATGRWLPSFLPRMRRR